MVSKQFLKAVLVLALIVGLFGPKGSNCSEHYAVRPYTGRSTRSQQLEYVAYGIVGGIVISLIMYACFRACNYFDDYLHRRRISQLVHEYMEERRARLTQQQQQAATIDGSSGEGGRNIQQV